MRVNGRIVEEMSVGDVWGVIWAVRNEAWLWRRVARFYEGGDKEKVEKIARGYALI